jgi:hypothetical protein
LQDFVQLAQLSVDVNKARPDRLGDVSGIPADFLDQFRGTPVPIARLLASGQYVNAANFDEKPNLRYLKQFLLFHLNSICNCRSVRSSLAAMSNS